MQWDDSINGGFSNADPGKLYAPVIDSGDYSYQHINVQKMVADSNSLLHQIKALINIRKNHPVLAVGKCQFLNLERSEILSLLRSNKDQNVLCILNLTNRDQSINYDLTEFIDCTLFDLFANKPFIEISQDLTSFDVPGYGFFWLKIQPA